MRNVSEKQDPILLSEKLSIALLEKAWNDIRRSKPASGIDAVEVQRFSRRASRRLKAIWNALSTGRYMPEPARGVAIPKKKGQKRLLMIPSIKDRIVQKAFFDWLTPYWEKQFLDCSYGYRPGKGHAKALNRVEHLLKRGYCWIASADIDDFFDSIHHPILLKMLREAGTPEIIVHVIEMWIRMGYVGWHGLEVQESGIPQGAIISPLLANIYLHPFDVAMRMKGFQHVRYADDYIVLCESRAEAHEVYQYARNFLREELGLEIQIDDRGVTNLEQGFEFLGIQFRKRKRSIAADKLQKIKEKFTTMAVDYGKKSASQFVDGLNAVIRGICNYYSRCNDERCWKEVNEALDDAIFQWARQRSVRLTGPDKRAFLRLERPRKISQRQRVQMNRKILRDLVPVTTAAARRRDRKRKRRKGGDASRVIEGKRRRFQRLLATVAVLFVGKSGSSIGVSGPYIRVRCDGRLVKKCHIKKLRHIVLANDRISVSIGVLRLCAEHRVGFQVIDFSGRTVSALTGPKYPAPEVWEAQLVARQNKQGPLLARTFVVGKIENQLRLLKYYDKYWRKAHPVLHEKFLLESRSIKKMIKKVKCMPIFSEGNLQEVSARLMGCEGMAAASYWNMIKEMLPAGVGFPGRQRRGARDWANQMLNYGYGILYGRAHSAITAAGLNPNWGFLHCREVQNPSLVWDFVEMFRPHVVDRAVFSILLRGGNVRFEEGRMADETRRLVVQRVFERLFATMRYGRKKHTLEEILFLKAQELRDYLMGKRIFFRPFLAHW